MICFTPESAQHLVEALAACPHFLHCGTIWVHGPASRCRPPRQQPRRPFGDYGIQKAAIEAYPARGRAPRRFPGDDRASRPYRRARLAPLNPAGHFNPAVFTALARGEELALPNFGLETVHHVHADDVAQVFMQAIANWSAAVGESFHVVSPAALTLRGYAEAMAAWFGREARLVFRPWDEWKAGQSDEEATATWDHIAHSPNCSIDKAERLLGYRPRYTSLAAVEEAVTAMIAAGVVGVTWRTTVAPACPSVRINVCNQG